VWLSAAAEGWSPSYTLHLFWGRVGSGRPGRVLQYAVTDNDNGVFDPRHTGADKWRRVYSNDSTFTFRRTLSRTARQRIETQTVDFIRSHTFFHTRRRTEGSLGETGVQVVSPHGHSPRRGHHRPEKGRRPAVAGAAHHDDSMGGQGLREHGTAGSGPGFGQVAPRQHGELRSQLVADDRVHTHAPRCAGMDIMALLPGARGFGQELDDAAARFGTYVFALQVKDDAGRLPVFDEDRNMRGCRYRRSSRSVMTVYNRTWER